MSYKNWIKKEKENILNIYGKKSRIFHRKLYQISLGDVGKLRYA